MPPSVPNVIAKTAESSLRPEMLILDYLLYDAIRLLLRHAHRDTTPAWKNPLRMVESFQTLFLYAHGAVKKPQIIAFRQHLLRFTTLFTLRHTVNDTSPSVTSLADLRFRNEGRVQKWTAAVSDKVLLFPPRVMLYYRDFDGLPQLLDGDVLMIDSSGGHTVDDDCPRRPWLIDLIPSFVALTARRVSDNPDWRNTSEWMQLAAEMMMQAAIEQYTVCGKGGNSALLEAFAWGLEGLDNSSRGITIGSRKAKPVFEDDPCINAVFRYTEIADAQADDSRAWADVREECLNRFLPPDTSQQLQTNASSREITDLQACRFTDIQCHLADLKSKYPIAEFEGAMLAFLEALCDSYDKPVLSQLEANEPLVRFDGQQVVLSSTL